MEVNKNRTLLHCLLFMPALVWVIYRLYAVDITHDEAWSFHMAYKQLYDNMTRTANNHWLNTFFMFIESKMIGVAVWKIRLHSLGAFLLLLFYLHKIAQRIPNLWMGMLAIILVIYNTYTLDFFSLARGYALGLAFGMSATYYLLYQAEGTKNRLRIYGLLCLAAASVYTELYLLLAYGLYEMLFVFKLNIFSKKKFINFIKPLWLPAIFLFFAIKNILFIKENGDLNEGLSNGFFQDSLGVFIERAFEPWFYSHTATIIGIVLFALLLLSIMLPAQLRHSSRSKQLAILLLIVFSIHQLFFYALGTPFAFGRTALYYIVPLFVLCGIFLGELKWNNAYSPFPPILFLILLGGHITYATQHKNINTTYEWWMGQGVNDVVQKISSIEKRDFDSLSILIYEGHNGDYDNYHLIIPNKRIIRKKSRIHLFHLHEDFEKINRNPNTFDYILLPDYDSLLNATIQFKQYDSLAYYPNMKTWLLRKK